VMCDIWKADHRGQELTRADLAEHIEHLSSLDVKQVVLSGGEALMHSNLWGLCELLRRLSARIILLSAGLLLKQNAPEIIRWTDGAIVSLDGSQPVHDRIRNTPHAFAGLMEGVAALKALNPDYPVTGRSTLQRHNYFDLPNIIRAAREIGLDQISFLAADVASEAFSREQPWDKERVADVALTPGDVKQFEEILEETVLRFADDFAHHYIAESPDKLRRLVRYFAALNGQADFPANTCNAPWMSMVVEADGAVRSCFFHRPLGNIHTDSLAQILNSKRSVSFRRKLDVRTDPVCAKCVCTLNLASGASPGIRAMRLGMPPRDRGTPDLGRWLDERG
jgi:MoaA/NifB/PqqE/SkfB family radical SAM enzyme